MNKRLKSPLNKNEKTAFSKMLIDSVIFIKPAAAFHGIASCYDPCLNGVVRQTGIVSLL